MRLPVILVSMNDSFTPDENLESDGLWPVVVGFVVALLLLGVGCQETQKITGQKEVFSDYLVDDFQRTVERVQTLESRLNMLIEAEGYVEWPIEKLCVIKVKETVNIGWDGKIKNCSEWQVKTTLTKDPKKVEWVKLKCKRNGQFVGSQINTPRIDIIEEDFRCQKSAKDLDL